VTHLGRGEPAPAAEYLQQVLAERPDWTEARFQYAVALDGLGATSDAIRQYHQVVQERPRWEAPLNNLAWHLATSNDPKLRNPAEAVRLAEAACREADRHASYLDTLATAYAANGQRDQAIAVAREGLQKAEQADLAPLVESFRQLISRLERQAPAE
jgi:tetratricopeptide (TPR) repeat protein